jgi:uroporphyrin-III C-methyltransferase
MTVYLVGAGPGSADLLTLRAARLLAEADVVLHDALVGADVLALAARAKIYNVGKRAGRVSADQRFICRFLARMGRRHATVVRLKGGDPHLFARASEEIDACRAAGVAVETVPGVTAGLAAASALGVSLSARGLSRSVTFVTPSVRRGVIDDLHWADAAAHAETAVIYMGAREAGRVREALAERGVSPNSPVALVENAAAADQRIIRGRLFEIERLADELGDGPAVILVGEAIRADARREAGAAAA